MSGGEFSKGLIPAISSILQVAPQTLFRHTDPSVIHKRAGEQARSGSGNLRGLEYLLDNS